MLVHPDIDPVALRLGPLSVHWYGLMYLLGFWGGWWLLLKRAPRMHPPLSRDTVNDLVFYIIMGVIVGGRLGYTFFYNFSGFVQNPLVLLRIWEGGMSFHGGLIGVVIAFIWFARTHQLKVFDVGDFAVPMIPLGLFTGRIGNFINGELWGAPTTLPWGMLFPHAGAKDCALGTIVTVGDGLTPTCGRHPSMLYEAFLEGLVLFVILWWFAQKPRPRMAVSGLFLLGYGVFRSLVETVRLPDAHIGYLAGTNWLTMGMLLSAPVWIAGLTLMVLAYRKR